MKSFLLLFLLMVFGQAMFAQDTIKTFIITEARLHDTHRAYVEFTNMGTTAIDLKKFKVGQILSNAIVNGKSTGPAWDIFPAKMLQPGESFVFATVSDYDPKMYALGNYRFGERSTPENLLSEVDIQMHIPNMPGNNVSNALDSISKNYSIFNEMWSGQTGIFLQQQLNNGDSCVVDQVGGLFFDTGGRQHGRGPYSEGYDVAGFTGATKYAYLIRKYKVKQGNLNFAAARGVGLEDSEWIPIPMIGGATGWRMVPWTVGNHGNYQLDANTLKSDVITVDLANKKMIAPWGVGRRDAFISQFKKTPGVGWEYIMSEDSTSKAAHTGDKLVIYVCGDQLTRETFDIEVKAPAVTANMLLSKYNGQPSADYIDAGYQPWPRISSNVSGIDSIWGPNGGVPYAMRVDSLLELLEKPANATWEVIYASGVPKPDLTDGDKIRVTSENGSKKEYVISIGAYIPSDNVDLRSITWPEIPEYYKGLFGWKGDTIPSFGQKTLNYNLEVPLVYEGIPALIGKTNDTKATIEVTRAKSLSGSMADRTTSFKVVAEDKTTTATYNVVLNKEVSYDNIQPYAAEPFFSEIVKNWNWNGTSVLEITNPGNQPLDLSDYMIINYGGSSLATGIMNNQMNAYNMRYERYIPGYKWTASSATWSASPYLAEKDLSVNTIIQPGDVFTMGSTRTNSSIICDNVWNELSSGNPLRTQIDVEFSNTAAPCHTFINQWGETTLTDNGMPMGKYQNNNIALLKILNDSVKIGLKPATDPDDFRAIDFIGGNGVLWVMRGGAVTNGSPFSYQRKPQITKGNPEPVASFGLKEIVDSEEWNIVDGDRLGKAGYGWPRTMLFVLQDVGKHYMIPATSYKSTVTSTVYKVSEGFTMKESIRGVKQGTTVADFYNNIIKANTAQSLKVLSGAVELLDTDMPKNGDILKVMSADSANVTQYVLNVNTIGLSTDAIIKSTFYTVKTTVNPDGSNFGKGIIDGVATGTLLKDAIKKLVMPNYSSVNIINEKGAYVALKTVNYTDSYVDVMVNQNVFVEVIAENGVTGMLYQFMPVANASDAFITSNIFSVDQTAKVVSLVPYGINVSNFLDNIIPSLNATYKIVDKMGFERQKGFVAHDDRVIVTSADKTKTVTYFISRVGRDELNQLETTNYFAYILSETYNIDQVINTVHGLVKGKSVGEFMNNVVVSTGATASVYSRSGVLKEAGSMLESTDVVKVALITGTLEVTYTFSTFVGVTQTEAGHQYLVYPNPTNSNINVIGLMKGQKLSVYNFAGERIKMLNVDANQAQISLDGKPAGIYMIVISENDKVVATFKTQKL